jgi:hypothetical protein
MDDDQPVVRQGRVPLFYRFAKGPSVVGGSAAFPAFPSNFVWSSTEFNVFRGGASYKF